VSDPERLVARLEQGWLGALADLCLDEVLARRAGDLLPASVLARHLAAGIRQAAARPDLRPWLAERLVALRSRSLDPGPGGRRFPRGDTLRGHLPAELTDPLERLLAEPYLPDRALVLRLLDHDAMHTLIQEVLQAALVHFARKMRSLGPDGSLLKAGLGRAARLPPGLSRLRSIGSDVVSAVGSELEYQLEQRVSEHVSQAISAVLGQVATLLSAPERAATMGDWRAYGLRVVLDTELEAFAAEGRKLDPALAARALADGLTALARHPDLEARIEAGALDALAPWADRTLGSLLDDAGLRGAWRDAWREAVVTGAGPILRSPGFQAWLAGWLGDEQPPG